jgi:hypothetical protein
MEGLAVTVFCSQTARWLLLRSACGFCMRRMLPTLPPAWAAWPMPAVAQERSSAGAAYSQGRGEERVLPCVLKILCRDGADRRTFFRVCALVRWLPKDGQPGTMLAFALVVLQRLVRRPPQDGRPGTAAAQVEPSENPPCFDHQRIREERLFVSRHSRWPGKTAARDG